SRATQDVEIAVAVPIDHERIAVVPFDLERGVSRLYLDRHRSEFTAALSPEQMKRAREVARNQIQLSVVVPIDCKRARADIIDPVVPSPGFALHRNDQRLAVRTFQLRRFLKLAVRLAPEHLEQSSHLAVHAGIGAREDVTLAVAVEVHKLWSRARA